MLEVAVLFRPELFTQDEADGLRALIRDDLPGALAGALSLGQPPNTKDREIVVRILVAEGLEGGNLVATAHDPVTPLTRKEEQRVAEKLHSCLVSYALHTVSRQCYINLRINAMAGRVTGTLIGFGVYAS